MSVKWGFLIEFVYLCFYFFIGNIKTDVVFNKIIVKYLYVFIYLIIYVFSVIREIGMNGVYIFKRLIF